METSILEDFTKALHVGGLYDGGNNAALFASAIAWAKATEKQDAGEPRAVPLRWWSRWAGGS